MKALMYHYVRTVPEGLPHFRYLHMDNFRLQLDWLAANHPVLPRAAFFDAVETGKATPGTVLTFDDGFWDHAHMVWPELVKRGLWGLFYVPTAIFHSPKILDVHRIHLILGHWGGSRALSAAKDMVTGDMLSEARMEEFERNTYGQQDNDQATVTFKRMFNYFLRYDCREPILDRLMEQAFGAGGEARLKAALYATPKELRAMHASGMVIGSHSRSHPVMSRLSHAEQQDQITESFATLSDIIGAPVTTFCYPYGGAHTFTAETEAMLERQGCRFSFSVEPRDISDHDLAARHQALPRYDCNMFPHGAAHEGPHAP